MEIEISTGISRERQAHLYHLALIGHEDLKKCSKEELNIFIKYTGLSSGVDHIETYVTPNMEQVVVNWIRSGGPQSQAPSDGDVVMEDPLQAGGVKAIEVGVSLLHVVASQGHTDLVRVLLDVGCDVNSVTSLHRYTVLHMAIQAPEEPPLELVNMLLEAGVDTSRVGGHTKGTALHMALHRLYSRLVAPLVAAGCPIDARCADGLTALYMAVSSRHHDCIRELVRAGACADIATPTGWTPLFLAVRSNRMDIPQLLVTGNCDVNVKGYGGTALHHAIYHANLRGVKLLLQAGADPDVASEGGHTPLTVAAYNDSQAIVEALLQHGCNVNQATAHGYTALHLAAWDGHVHILDMLLAASALFDTPTKDFNTPLALACHGNKPDVIGRLLPHGCSVNNKDKDSDTPLHYVAYNGCMASLRLLLDYGADPNARNSVQATPLWNAVHMGFGGMARELVRCNVALGVASKGINQHAQTDHVVLIYTMPRTPLFVALDRGLFELARCLVLAGADMTHESWFWRREFPNALDKNAAEMRHLVALVCTPLSLKHICRGYVRLQCGLKVHSVVRQFEIPNTLKDFLLLTEEFCNPCPSPPPFPFPMV